MSQRECYRVVVKDEHGREVVNWTASLFSDITLKTEGGKTIIEKKGLLGARTYIPAMNESVEARNWWGHII